MASAGHFTPRQGSAEAEWLLAEGETGRMIAERDWSRTPLGPLASWPVHMRVVVNLMLTGGAPMAMIWGEHRVLLYNDRHRELLQDKHPAALGQSAEMVFPEVWTELQPLFEQVFRGEAVQLDDISLPLVRKGKRQDASFSGSYNPIRNAAGKVEGFLAVVSESTAVREAEQNRLRIFETTMSSIVDFAYSFDRAGRFLYVNKALLDLWGLTLDQAVGKNFFDLHYPPELASRLQRQIEEVFVEKKILRDETRYVSASGVEGYYEYIFSPVFGKDGTVIVVGGSTRDITARVKLERDLRDMKARLETSLAAGAIGTWSWDVASNQVVADHILTRFFSVSEEDAQGGPIEAYLRAIHPEDRGVVAQKIQEVLAQGASYEAEYRLIGADGHTRWVVARASILRDEAGRAVALPGMVIDITERKRLEQRLQETIRDLRTTQLQLERQAGELETQVKERTARLQETVAELETFSYSISHDLRGPLRVMQNFAEALREDCGETIGVTGKDYIRRIVAAAVRMDRIIQDVLSFSRIARAELPLERVELGEFVRGLVETYPAFHNDKTAITVDGAMPAVLANPAALTQCFVNLVGNALKFVAPGSRPAVRIFAREENGRVFVSVADNGIGIPKRAHEAIFNVFYRHEAGYEGTGLGLAIVRKAVERLGGRIAVDAEPGRGSTFTFDLPQPPN